MVAGGCFGYPKIGPKTDPFSGTKHKPIFSILGELAFACRALVGVASNCVPLSVWVLCCCFVGSLSKGNFWVPQTGVKKWAYFWAPETDPRTHFGYPKMGPFFDPIFGYQKWGPLFRNISGPISGTQKWGQKMDPFLGTQNGGGWLFWVPKNGSKNRTVFGYQK